MARETSEEIDRRPEGRLMLKSRSGRPVKAKKLVDNSETEDDEDIQRTSRSQKRTPQPSSRSGHHERSQPAKRQRWVPHNPLLFGKTEDDSSKDIQISDEEESGEESLSKVRRRSAGATVVKGPSVPMRDESGRFAGTRQPTEQERQQAALTASRGGSRGGGIFKNAAVQVLRSELKLMSTGEIARLAMKRGYVKVQGRTPEATMASAMYTDVKRKEDRSLFIRPHEGLFGLREWIDEGIEYLDPAEAQPSRLGLQRSRMSNPSSSQPNSRTSNRLVHARSRSIEESHHHDDYSSQATSARGESLHDRDARCGEPPMGTRLSAIDLRAGRYDDPTPFGGDHGSGPPAELFKPAAEHHGRNGLSNVRKRSISGPLASIVQATTSRRPPRKTSLTMSPQNSGHMSLLLDAVELENRSSGLLLKPAPYQEARRPSGILQPQVVHPRTESGYNIFGNKPLPFQNQPAIGERIRKKEGSQCAGQWDPEAALPPLNETRLQPASKGELSHEEAFQQLEASFVSQPLQISHSLLAPLPAAIPPLNLSTGKEQSIPSLNLGRAKDPDGSGVSTTTALPAVPPVVSQFSSPSLASKGLRIPGSAFQVTGPPQMPNAVGAPNFGPPEEGIKRIPEIEAHVQAMESSLGVRHPRVGKGYLYLSRVYQLRATTAPEYYQKAQQALTHAYEICYAGQVMPKGAGNST